MESKWLSMEKLLNNMKIKKLNPVEQFLVDLEISAKGLKNPKVRKEALKLLGKCQDSYKQFKKENR
jgi:hypothetical protein